MSTFDRYLVLFDADRIKDYVFATGRLKEIRGASEMVRQLTDTPLRVIERINWRPTRTPSVIYAGGGAGALCFDRQDDAEAFCLHFERYYKRVSGSGSVSAIYVPIEGADLAAEQRAQSRAAHKLASRKAARPRAEQIAGGGYLRFCDSDRLYPASVDQRDPDSREPALFSRASAAKRQLSRQYTQQIAQQPFWQIFQELQPDDAARQRWSAAIRETQDLEAIGAQSQVAGYIAFLHADGDGIGSLIRSVVETHGLAGYGQLSAALNEAATRATAMALAAAYPPPAADSNRALPFEVITIGGDDVMLVCTAERGLEIAEALSSGFQRELAPIVERLLGTDYPRPSASVGVVIAHDSHPIINLQTRASELLKHAKRVHGGDGIDFHIVSTPGLEPIKTIRQIQYYDRPGEAVRTMRPYQRTLFKTFLEQARLIHTLPGSKRAQLYDAAVRAPDSMSVTFDVLRVQARMRTSDRTNLLLALQRLGVGVRYPFAEADAAGLLLPLLDLIEAAEFVVVKEDA